MLGGVAQSSIWNTKQHDDDFRALIKWNFRDFVK